MTSSQFASRSTLPEKMDQDDVKPVEIEKALNELAFINKYLGGYKVTLNAINAIAAGKPLSVVDYGCGGGDVLRKIYDWGKKHNIQLKCTGVDINPVMINYCLKHNGDRKIQYLKMSIWDNALLSIPCDVAVNSLFCHHFDDAELVVLLKRMHLHAARAVIINDLHRHSLAYHSIRILTNLFSGSYLVKYDGPLSVKRSLRKSEWIDVIEKADVKKYSIKWFWAFRWQIILLK